MPLEKETNSPGICPQRVAQFKLAMLSDAFFDFDQVACPLDCPGARTERITVGRFAVPFSSVQVCPQPTAGSVVQSIP